MVLIKKKKKTLPCGLKIVQHSPSAEWRNVLAGHHVGVDAAGCRLGHGPRPGGQKEEASGSHCVLGLMRGRWHSRTHASPMAILSLCDPLPQRGPGAWETHSRAVIAEPSAKPGTLWSLPGSKSQICHSRLVCPGASHFLFLCLRTE